MISLIIHGGAWDIPDDVVEAHRSGCSKSLTIGWRILQEGGSAVDAIENVIRFLEDDETFDAGRGSHLNALGKVELDASIMDGRTLRCGAVAAVHRIRNPISLARKIMEESEHILLVGNGAEQFATEHGILLFQPEDLIIQREKNRWQEVQHYQQIFKSKDFFHGRKKPASDTVGAIARDKNGNISVGTSTGGTLNKYPGRIGDSPLIGCGTYADNEIGGVSTTGWGEGMIKVVMAKSVIEIMNSSGGDPESAAQKGIEILKQKVEGYGGVIVLNKQGHVGFAFNTPRMARAFITSKMKEPVVAV